VSANDGDVDCVCSKTADHKPVDASISWVARDLSRRRRSSLSSRKPTLVYFTDEERKLVDQAAGLERRSISSFVANATLEAADRAFGESAGELTTGSSNRELRAWERTCNTVRPHQALAYLTPFQFLRQLSSQRKE
jgi:uncharacterized protein (DUF1778 family)